MREIKSPELFTIGVYGYTEQEFFTGLKDAKIDLFCDVRARRGLRGSTYAFANSAYLQDKLTQLGIAYKHFPHLAPNKSIRDAQDAYDKKQGINRRDRTQLSDEFVHAYHDTVLSDFDPQTFWGDVAGYQRIVLFCVEHTATACHRSLLAERLVQDTNFVVKHIE